LVVVTGGLVTGGEVVTTEVPGSGITNCSWQACLKLITDPFGKTNRSTTKLGSYMLTCSTSGGCPPG
jgi:hypothetical protein